MIYFIERYKKYKMSCMVKLQIYNEMKHHLTNNKITILYNN